MKNIPDIIDVMRRSLSEQMPELQTGMWDKLIHGYFGVNLKRVWGTVMIDLPPLRLVVSRMLVENPDFSDRN